MKLLLRIFFSPFILIFTFLVLLFSAATLALILGIPEAIYHFFKNKKDFDWSMHFLTTFYLIWYPIYITIKYLKE